MHIAIIGLGYVGLPLSLDGSVGPAARAALAEADALRAAAPIPVETYDERLTTVLDGTFENLQLRIFERHDLVLAKIVRNNDRDRADVAAIAGGPGLDIEVLRTRYLEELRPKLGRPEREDLTLQLWIEIIEETRKR